MKRWGHFAPGDVLTRRVDVAMYLVVHLVQDDNCNLYGPRWLMLDLDRGITFDISSSWLAMYTSEHEGS